MGALAEMEARNAVALEAIGKRIDDGQLQTKATLEEMGKRIDDAQLQVGRLQTDMTAIMSMNVFPSRASSATGMASTVSPSPTPLLALPGPSPTAAHPPLTTPPTSSVSVASGGSTPPSAAAVAAAISAAAPPPAPPLPAAPPLPPTSSAAASGGSMRPAHAALASATHAPGAAAFMASTPRELTRTNLVEFAVAVLNKDTDTVQSFINHPATGAMASDVWNGMDGTARKDVVAVINGVIMKAGWPVWNPRPHPLHQVRALPAPSDGSAHTKLPSIKLTKELGSLRDALSACTSICVLKPNFRVSGDPTVDFDAVEVLRPLVPVDMRHGWNRDMEVEAMRDGLQAIFCDLPVAVQPSGKPIDFKVGQAFEEVNYRHMVQGLINVSHAGLQHHISPGTPNSAAVVVAMLVVDAVFPPHVAKLVRAKLIASAPQEAACPYSTVGAMLSDVCGTVGNLMPAGDRTMLSQPYGTRAEYLAAFAAAAAASSSGGATSAAAGDPVPKEAHPPASATTAVAHVMPYAMGGHGPYTYMPQWAAMAGGGVPAYGGYPMSGRSFGPHASAGGHVGYGRTYTPRAAAAPPAAAAAPTPGGGHAPLPHHGGGHHLHGTRPQHAHAGGGYSHPAAGGAGAHGAAAHRPFSSFRGGRGGGGGGRFSRPTAQVRTMTAAAPHAPSTSAAAAAAAAGLSAHAEGVAPSGDDAGDEDAAAYLDGAPHDEGFGASSEDYAHDPAYYAGHPTAVLPWEGYVVPASPTILPDGSVAYGPATGYGTWPTWSAGFGPGGGPMYGVLRMLRCDTLSASIANSGEVPLIDVEHKRRDSGAAGGALGPVETRTVAEQIASVRARVLLMMQHGTDPVYEVAFAGVTRYARIPSKAPSPDVVGSPLTFGSISSTDGKSGPIDVEFFNDSGAQVNIIRLSVAKKIGLIPNDPDNSFVGATGVPAFHPFACNVVVAYSATVVARDGAYDASRAATVTTRCIAVPDEQMPCEQEVLLGHAVMETINKYALLSARADRKVVLFDTKPARLPATPVALPLPPLLGAAVHDASASPAAAELPAPPTVADEPLAAAPAPQPAILSPRPAATATGQMEHSTVVADALRAYEAQRVSLLTQWLPKARSPAGDSGVTLSVPQLHLAQRRAAAVATPSPSSPVAATRVPAGVRVMPVLTMQLLAANIYRSRDYLPAPIDDQPFLLPLDDFLAEQRATGGAPTPEEIKAAVTEPIIAAVATDYADIFGPASSATIATEVKVKVTTDEPFRAGIFRTHHHNMEELRKTLMDLLANGFIRRSENSPYNSPLVFVRKPDGSTRMCVDLRMLNSITVPDPAIAPRVDDLLRRTRGCGFFTKLDIKSAFHQIKLHPDSCKYFAFTTPFGRFEYTRLPFGWVNSPSKFQGEIMEALRPAIEAGFCSVYMDDILIHSATMEEHLRHVAEVFRLIHAMGARLALGKCTYAQPTASFLGMIVDGTRCYPDPERMQGIKDMPTPRTLRGVQSFLGLCNYYAPSVPGMADIVAPLRDLAKPGTRVAALWAPLHDAAFGQAKKAMIEAVARYLPDFTSPFVLRTDASVVGIGATLVQYDRDNVERLVACFSRALTSAEAKWNVTERECLAAVEAIHKFDMLLHPTQQFVWQTDHANLVHLRDSANARVQRWAMALGGYDFVVEHVPGVLNVAADALSRVIDEPDDDRAPQHDHVLVIARRSMQRDSAAVVSKPTTTTDPPRTSAGVSAYNPLTSTDVGAYRPHDAPHAPARGGAGVGAAAPTTAAADSAPATRPRAPAHSTSVLLPTAREIAAAQDAAPPAVKARWAANGARVMSVPDAAGGPAVSVLCMGGNMLVPEEATPIIERLLQLAHDQGGHQGAHRTLARLWEARVQWLGMSKAVDEFCASCPSCQHAKAPAGPVAAGKMAGAPIPAVPFDVIVIDYVGPLVKSATGYAYVLVIMDMFTRWVELVPTKSAGSDAVEAALERLFLRFGIPRLVQSDQGSHFTSSKMAAMAAAHGFSHHLTTPRHPESNGMLERQNKTLVTTIKAYVERNSARWSSVLERVQWDLNTAVNAAMGMSPFTALFGFHPSTRVAAAVGAPRTVRTLTEHHAELEDARERAHSGLLAARALNKERYDRGRRDVSFAPGDHVLVFGDNTKEHKLHPVWYGPCKVTAKLSELTYTVHDPVMDRHTTQHVANMRHFNMSRTSEHEQEKRLLDEGVFIIEAIIAHRPNGERLDFLVQYEDDPEPTWHDADGLQRLTLFKSYVAAHKLEAAVKAATRRTAAPAGTVASTA